MPSEEIGLLFGFGLSLPPRNRRAEVGEPCADGGKCTRLDRLIDDDGPLRANGGPETGSQGENAPGHKMSRFLADHPEDHMSTRKHFFVRMESRQGGNGLWQGHREPKKSKEEKE